MTGIERKINLNDTEALKTRIFGLTMACPMDDKPIDCPLHEIRLLSVEDRFDWVENLSSEKCVEIYLFHEQCSSEKLSIYD